MKTLASILPRFFTDRLQKQRQASEHTIAAYRDTFRLLIGFAQQRLKKEPVTLLLDDFSPELVVDFLSHLETTRDNSARTRNARLAAIRSFFRFVASQEPDCLQQAQRILAIPQKRYDRTLVCFLTQPEMEAFLNAVDKSTWVGRRDFTMLLLMLQTGIRISEAATLRMQDVVFGTGAHLICQGKGRKERLYAAHTPNHWRFARLDRRPGSSIRCTPFSIAEGPMLRDAIERRVAVYAERAQKQCPSLKGKKVTPHVLRHTTAVQLLSAGVDTSIIALWLGHELLETTQIYLQADLSMKERALAQTTPLGLKLVRYLPQDPLLRFLETL